MFSVVSSSDVAHATPRMAAVRCSFWMGACAQGPRPPSEKWPVAHRPSSVGRWRSGQFKPTPPKVAGVSPQEFKPCRTPEVAVSEAVGEVKKLEAVIAALGPDSAHAKGLHEALRIARARSKLPPVAERVVSCKKFLDRARQRVVRAQDVIDKATAQKKVHEEEVVEGERRLAQLCGRSVKACGSASTGVRTAASDRRIDPRTRCSSHRVGDGEETHMVGHRTSFHRHRTAHSHRSTGVGGLVERPKLRFKERNRVREPRSCGSNWTSHWTGRETVGEITRPVQCAHERSGEIFHDSSSDRSSRRQEEVRRVHTVGRESGVRYARYGLRGVRVGEASHPGPQGRRTQDISDEVLDNLERELRLDDEPLVRSAEGRNVVPRISYSASERRRSDVHSFVHDEGVPAESIPTWVDLDADECSVSSESCWCEQEDLIGEEIPEWGVLPCVAPVVPPVEDFNTRAEVHHRPSRRLVFPEPESLSPLAHEDENEADHNQGAIQFDVADTESVVTVPEDGFDEDPAEEDEVISEGGV